MQTGHFPGEVPAIPRDMIYFQAALVGLNEKQIEGMTMKRVLALVVAAAMGLSSAAFAAGRDTCSELRRPPKQRLRNHTHRQKQHKAAPARKRRRLKAS